VELESRDELHGNPSTAGDPDVAPTTNKLRR
jgi:hypothetical protein